MPATVIDHSKKNVAKLVRSVYNKFMKEVPDTVQDEKITIIVCDDYIKQVYPQTRHDKGKYDWLTVTKGDTLGSFKLDLMKGGSAQYKIYLQKEIFELSDYEYVLVHELCHFKDYIFHYQQSSNHVLKNEYYQAFSFWSEFNAARVETTWRKVAAEKAGVLLSLQKMAHDILEDLRAYTFMSSKLYRLAHYYAILSLLDKDGELFFDHYVFPEAVLQTEFRDYWNPLYYLLYTANAYEKFYRQKDNLKNILDKVNTIRARRPDL